MVNTSGRQPRPRIGISCSFEPDCRRVFVRDTYIEALRAADGRPVLIPTHAAATAMECLDCIDGLLLSGGPDLHPARYGAAEVHPSCQPAAPERDQAEFGLVDAAARRGLPVLGICRGLQVLNVALGGSLHQDLGAAESAEPVHPIDYSERQRLSHGVDVAAGSWLAGCVGAGTALRIEVNSLHHQGIDRLAAGFRATALAPDGLIEAFEAADGRPIYGVQWHPEDLFTFRPEQAEIFRRFVELCLRIAP